MWCQWYLQGIPGAHPLFSGGFVFHLRNRFDFILLEKRDWVYGIAVRVRRYLEDEKSVVVEVDAMAFQKHLDFSVGALFSIDGVLTWIVFVCRPSDDELGFGVTSKASGPGRYSPVDGKLTGGGGHFFYQVDNLSKVDPIFTEVWCRAELWMSPESVAWHIFGVR